MADQVLWKVIDKTDFKAMHGVAIIPGANGGGARHIVLGQSLPRNDVRGFLPPTPPGADGKYEVHVPTLAHGATPASELIFASNPNRRNGEWLISDQKAHRHPAWMPAAGFPAERDEANPPVVLVFRTEAGYVPAFLLAEEFAAVAPELAKRVRGVAVAPPLLLLRAGMLSGELRDFAERASDTPEDQFNPDDVQDARARIFAAIVRRQGQQQFRSQLFDLFDGRCAMTGCTEPWVLEAAHITPYRGADTNVPSNGLLLRADLHTLYDLGLIGIEPETCTIRVSGKIAWAEYRALDGSPLQLGKATPSKAALRQSWPRFQP